MMCARYNISLCGLLLALLAGCNVITADESLQKSQAAPVKKGIGVYQKRKDDAFAKPNYSIYHTKQDSLAYVAHLVDSSASMTLERIEEYGDEGDEYKAGMDIVTYDASGKSDDTAPRIVLDFGEHGRELITNEVALGLLRCLSDEAELRRLVTTYLHLDVQKVQSILNDIVLKIIPMENENGRAKVEEGDLCERKNGRGVDPNRNWSVDWGVKEPDYDPKEEYPGKKAFSEPEVKILKKLAERFKPDVFINVHSGMEAMFVPFDHKNTIAYGRNVNATLEIFENINSKFCKGACSIGSGGATVGYLAHGTLTDYLHEMGIPITSTWEIYGDEKADFDDCFKMFNPLDHDSFAAYVDRWVAILVFFITELTHHPATEAKFIKGKVDIPPPKEINTTFTFSPVIMEGDQRPSFAYYQPLVICMAMLLLYKAKSSVMDRVKSEEFLPRFTNRKKHYVSIS